MRPGMEETEMQSSLTLLPRKAEISAWRSLSYSRKADKPATLNLSNTRKADISASRLYFIPVRPVNRLW